MSYEKFIDGKLSRVPPTGLDGAMKVALADGLFDFQESLVRWALARGRAAIFADTGLGKSRMQLAWADAVHRETGHDVLILAPLAVAQQTVIEGANIGVEVIRRGIDLWTNPGDVVLSPFMGIGSEGYVALEMGRRFVGVELKESYFQQAARNLDAALAQPGLFSAAAA